MKLSKFIQFMSENLDISLDDSSNNGLQVGDEDKEIKKIGFAVDANLETFRKAKDNNCDLLIVHHGISWNDSLKSISGSNYKRVSYLIKNDLALAAYHLPLDKDQHIGNNIKLAELLKLKKIREFDVGYVGELRQDLDADTLTKFLNNYLKTECKTYNFGKHLIHRIAIISGTGGNPKDVEEASQISDCLLTGDAHYGIKNLAKDLNFNVILAGHYETETLGLKALTQLLNRKLDLDLIFINQE